MKIIINKCAGGFNLSQKAYKYLLGRGMTLADISDPKIQYDEFVIFFDELTTNSDEKLWDGCFRYGNLGNRSHPLLVEVVETLGEKASGPYAKLGVVEIPDNVDYIIEEYDGIEWVAEKHRTWS